MSEISVVLSEQNLGEFLEGNREYMDAYAAEMQKRLSEHFDSAEVEISRSALEDKIFVDDELVNGNDAYSYVADKMVNDWSWLPE